MAKLNTGILLLFLIYLNGFSQSIEKFIDSTIKVDRSNVPIDFRQPYFPKELTDIEINKINKKDSTQIINLESRFSLPVKWYSKNLYAMKEPLLFNRRIDKKIYRFTWLRTFNDPMTFRIEKWKSRYMLYWKVLDRTSNYDLGELKTKKLKILSEKEWRTFINLIKKADFWNMKLGKEFTGEDGSEWIMEGVNSNNYRVVTVWSPSKGDFYNACNYLISLTDLNISDKDKY